MKNKKKAVHHVQKNDAQTTRQFLARQAVYAQRELPIKAIIINTYSGTSAKLASAYRGKRPIYALSPNKTIVRQLNLSYGVRAYYLPKQKSTEKLVSQSLKLLSKKYQFNKKDYIIILGKTDGPVEQSNFLEIATVEHILGKNK